MITVTINGKDIKLEKPVTILEAARTAGIEIPTLCYHESLELYGGCRLCLVEVEKMPKLQTACTLYVTDGMVVRTESEQIADARRGILEFLLINHPLDCPYCDKAGECDLQDLVEKYGPTAGRFAEGKRKHPESFDDPIIVRNMERCVMCTRCVRMCDGVQGDSAIAVTNRGSHSFIEPFSGGRYNCEYCGNCLTVCPVGAIMSRLHRHSYRAWLVETEVNTVCSYCGVGCSMVIQVRNNSINRVVPRFGLGINNGLLCVRGRFGYDYVGNEQRIKSPLVKKGGKLEPVTWNEAFNTVAARLKALRERYGGSALAGIASGRCTNEENYVFQKLMRCGLGTNNIDSSARLGYSGAQRYLENIFGQGVTANPIYGIANSEAILIVGGDPTAINPILGLQIRTASRNGARVITIGYAPGLERFNSIGLKPRIFTEGILLSGILCEILKIKPFTGENQTLESVIKGLSLRPAREIAEICRLAEDDIRKAVEAICNVSSISIVIGQDIIQRSNGNRNLFMLSSIGYMLNARMTLLSERPNEQGTIDMGCLPDMLPGGRPLEIETFRKRYEGLAGTEIPSGPGLTLMEMVEAAEAGQIKAMYIMGENPVFNLPDSNAVKKALGSLEFLVVQDIFLSETAKIADVVLPALAWSEKEGTYTNLERRMQHVRRAVDIQGMEDWRIISEIGKRLEVSMPYNSSEDIMAEMVRVSPLHTGLTYEDVDKGNALWPYKGEPLRAEMPSLSLSDENIIADKGKLYLMVRRPLFHSGTLSRRSYALNNICSEPYLRISRAVAERLSVKDGDVLKVSTVKGSLQVKTKVDISLNDSAVLLTNNFEGMGAFSLLGYKLDPVTKAPGIEGTEVTIGCPP